MSASRWLRSSSGFATIGTVFALLATSVLALVGVGTEKSWFDFGSGFAWLQSDDPGQALMVNGADGKGSAKLNIPGAKGKKMRVEQRDGHAYVVVDEDGETKVLYRLDDASLTTGAQRRIGKAEQIVRGGDAAFLVNEDKGVVQPIDPDSLEPRGEKLTFQGPIGVAAGDDSRLLVVEEPAASASLVENGGAGQAMSIGDGGDQLTATVAGGRTAAVNASKNEVTRFEDGKPAKVVLPAGRGDLLVPDEGESDELVILRRDGDRGELVRANLEDGAVAVVGLQATVAGVKAPLAAPGVVYLLDTGAGRVITVDPVDGRTVSTVDAGVGRGDSLEAFVKDGYLWLNNPGDQKAVVIDRQGRMKEVDKYDEAVPVLNPETPPDEPTPPTNTPPPQPSPSGSPAPNPTTGTPTPDPTQSLPAGSPPPVANAPGMPTGFTGTPSNRSISLSWSPPTGGGAPIDRYSLRCNPDCGSAGSSIELGNVQTAVVSGLENGTSYDFELTASNSIGTGPPATATDITPTGDVPAQPDQVQATANDDGTVTVSWQAGSEGLTLTGFEIVAASDSAAVALRSPSPFSVTDPQATSFRTTPGDLGYDPDDVGDWSFTVKALATKDGARVESPPSSPSPKVDVYEAPSFPAGASLGGTGGDRSVTLQWRTADHNGRSVDYAVSQCAEPCAGGFTSAQAGTPSLNGSQMSSTITGLSNGVSYRFQVVASNDAGNSQPLTSAALRVHVKPSISLSAPDSDTSSIWATVSVDFKGDSGTCSVSSPASQSVGCSGRVTVGSLSPSTEYILRVCAQNQSGDSECAQVPNLATKAPPRPAPPSVSAMTVVIYGGGHVGVAFTVAWPSPDSEPITCVFQRGGVEIFRAQCGTRPSNQFYGQPGGSQTYSGYAIDRYGQQSSVVSDTKTVT